jgi:hypothetical protein
MLLTHYVVILSSLKWLKIKLQFNFDCRGVLSYQSLLNIMQVHLHRPESLSQTLG